MGEVRARALVENGGDAALARRGMLDVSAVRRVDVEMVVDTGMVVVLPQNMVEALGVEQYPADDRLLEMPIAGPLRLTVFRHAMSTDCLVGPARCQPRLGQIVLDRFVDPIKMR
jgi:hypothetical protein